MICGEDQADGSIHCDIRGRPNVDVVFDIENFTEYKGVIDDHMEDIFADTCVVDIDEG